MTVWSQAAPSIAVAVCAAALGWWAARGVAAALRAHRDRLTHISRVQLEELFLFIDPEAFLRLNLLALLVAAVFGTLVAGPAGAATAAAVCAVAPAALHRSLRRRRLRALERQLPDVADSIASSIRAGLGLGQAIARVALHQPAPAMQEFSLVLREHRLGVTLDQALAAAALRCGLRDLYMLVAVLGIARDLGGGLAAALERLSASMRRRLAMEDRIRALTSQGRLQAVVMGLLPILLCAVLSLLEPEQMRRLYTEPLGWLALSAVLLLEVGGFVLLRRIVRIEV